MKHGKMALAVAGALAGWQAAAPAQQAPWPAPAIEEVFVLGEFVPDEKRDTSEISNVLTTEDMALLGDSEVAESLERVTGLSLVGGKFIYVRGLGERYSATFLNGSPISSPVPFQKTVPLDIVPNNLVESLLVQKTWSPQHSGDFSGGVVQIRTKTIPDEDYLDIHLGSGGNSESSLGDGLAYRGGQDDNWGHDDGSREIPRNIAAMSSEEFQDTDYPERAALGASFHNNWDILQRELNLDGDVSGELGRRFEFASGMALGITAAGKYKNSWRNQFRDMRRYEFTGVAGGYTQTVDFAENSTVQTIDASGFLNAGWELDADNSLSLTSLALRQTSDEVEQRRGLSSEDNVERGVAVESYFLQWVENEIISRQLAGEHHVPPLNDMRIAWRAGAGESSREAPDTRSYTYADNRDGVQEVVTTNRQAAGDLRDVYKAPERNYSEQGDELQDWGLDLEWPFALGAADLTLEAGVARHERSRRAADRLFSFDLSFRAADHVPLMAPRQLFSLPNWQSGAVTVRDFSAGAANASGIFPFASSAEEVSARYIALDAQWTPRLRVQMGARREDASLEADAWGGNTPPGAHNSVAREYEDSLPAVSMTWEIVENMQVRLAYSETVNRPSLLEITGTTVRNPGDGNLYRGNVFLRPAEIANYDMRWEWYFGAADEMSLGLFHKEFGDPVELGKVQAQDDIYTWFNAERAELAGLEFDLRKELPLGDWLGASEALNWFALGFNVSFLDSEVTLLGEGETADDAPLTGGRKIARLFSNERRMTGQSDLLYNIILSYDNFQGLRGSLAYNFTGDRIALAGSESAPDVLEEERSQLDFTIKYSVELFQREAELVLKARNLLGQNVKFTQGGLIHEKFEPGASWSAGIALSF